MMPGMSDGAPVRLFHPLWPEGRVFDPVVARTQRRQGWTDGPDAEPEPEVDGAGGNLASLADLDPAAVAALDALSDDDLTALTDTVDAPSTTGPGRTNTGGPRG